MNSFVDLGKLFFAACVVGIHTHAFSSWRPVHTYIFALAVPFFFVCSGYFLGKKIGKAGSQAEYRTIIARYFKRLLIPYAIWGIWYFFLETAVSVVTEHTGLKEALVTRLYNWLISSPGGGLWYVQTLLIMLCILWISDSKQYRRVILIAAMLTSMIPAVIGAAGSTLMLHGINVYGEHVFVWDGLFFMAGLIFGETDNGKTGSNIPAAAFAGLFAVKVILNLTGITLFTRIINMLLAVTLFAILQRRSAPYSRETSLRMRRWSTIIYFTHMTVKYGVQFGFKILHWKESTLVFLISMIILVIYCVIVDEHFRDTKLFKLLYA